jgi:NADH:ubiquinone oxidoreductase subunit K
LEKFLILSAILFSIGLFGALSRRNIVAILMSLELMFTSVTLAAVAMSRYVSSRAVAANPTDTSEAALNTLLTGQVFALFIIVVAAAEVALGLGIVIALYRQRQTVDITQANLMSR